MRCHWRYRKGLQASALHQQQGLKFALQFFALQSLPGFDLTGAKNCFASGMWMEDLPIDFQDCEIEKTCGKAILIANKRPRL